MVKKTKEIDYDIPLNDKQIMMYNLLNSGQYTEFLFYGTSRSGKTFLILYWLIVQCSVYNATCLVVRQTFTSLQMGMIRQTLPNVLNAIAKHNGKSDYTKLIVRGVPFAKYNAKDNILTLYNKAYIQFASIRSGSEGGSSSYDKILSTEYAHIFMDEVSEIDYAAVEVLRSRLALKIDFVNCLLFALNPPSKLHWTYKRFFEHKTVDGECMKAEDIGNLYRMHFSKDDNVNFIAKDYYRQMSGSSSANRQRFLDGEYADVGSGKIFRNLEWLDRPNVADIMECIIYTDPSAKDGKTNDFKATVTLVRTQDQRIWFWDCRAIQGTSSEMIANMYELCCNAPIVPRLIMEKKQLPLDFDTTFKMFQQEKHWTAPLQWDTLNHGDKFTCIESILEPLVTSKRFVFCRELINCGCYEQVLDQFLRFSNNKNKDVKDDIPDACAKGTSFLNYNIVQSYEKTDDVIFYRRGSLTSMQLS